MDVNLRWSGSLYCSNGIFQVSTQCHDPNVLTQPHLPSPSLKNVCLVCTAVVFLFLLHDIFFFVFRPCIFCYISTTISALPLYLLLKVTRVTQGLRRLLGSHLLGSACPIGWLVGYEGVLSSSQDERAIFLYILLSFCVSPWCYRERGILPGLVLLVVVEMVISWSIVGSPRFSSLINKILPVTADDRYINIIPSTHSFFAFVQANMYFFQSFSHKHLSLLP